MHPFGQIFIALLTVTTLAGLYLSFRQYRSVQRSRSAVPDEFASKISLADHQKAADYTTAKLKLGSVESLYGVVWLLIWTFGAVWNGWISSGIHCNSRPSGRVLG